MTNELHEILERFNALPDDAILPSRVTGIILGVSERTIRYHPHLPRVRISRGRYGQRVGDIRKLCREGMSPYARLVYIALKSRYGFKARNNGRIYLSARDGAEETGFDMKTVARALRELKHYGFIVMTEPGCLGVNGKGKAPHWRLTELGYMTDPPTRDFLKWDGTLFQGQRSPKDYFRKKQNPIPSDGTDCTAARNIRAYRQAEQSPEKLYRQTEHTDEEARTVQRHISRVNHSPSPEWSPASLQPDLASLVVTDAGLSGLWRKGPADG